MSNTEFSEDPTTPLNQKINELYNCDPHRISDICYQIYNMGFEDGQSFVWKMRQKLFIDDPKNPGKQKTVFPEDPDYPNFDNIITVTDSKPVYLK